MKLPNAYPKSKQLGGVREKVRPRKGLKNRKRMKSRNAKRGGSSFPKQRDRAFTSWAVTQDCVLAGRWLSRRLSENDLDAAGAPSFLLRTIGGFWHVCWGDRTPAHVGPHRARGAADRGHVVCMCQAAHQEYDEHRSRFHRVTHLTEKRLENHAAGLALRYQETGGM